MRNSDFKLVLTVAAAFMVLFSAPSFTQDDDDEDVETVEKMDWLIWDSVERFTGQATVQLTTWTDRVSHRYYKEKNSSNSFSTFHFELVREPQLYSRGHSRWIAGKVRVSGNEAASSLDDSPTYRLAWSSQAAFDQAIVGDAVNLSLSLNHEIGDFQMLLPSRLDTPVPSHIKRSEWRLGEKTINEERTELVFNAVSTLFNGSAPKDISVLHATSENDYLEEDGHAGHRMTGRVVLVPEYSDFKVVVELEAYDDKGKQVSYEDWRPFGSIKEPGRAGNYIDVKAVLHPKRDMKPADLPKVKYFRFELVDTSREPGVAMNWPPNAKDKNPDLRLIVNQTSPGLPDKEGQSLVVSRPAKDAEGRPAAMARIDSYDFGGRTELKVTAKLEDGRTIFGTLEFADYTYTEIRIPKRLYGDWIADSWRIEHPDIQYLPDDSDDESKPEGDGDNGDGLTLYEEYRGFAVRRESQGRVEGDPKRKDFFILNLAGADAWDGIRMFEATTELRVIARLEPAEMDAASRVINGNRSSAPHVTEQHGVLVRTLTAKEIGHNGARAISTDPEPDAPLALKPKYTKHIGLPARNAPMSDFVRPYNLSVADQMSFFDTIVVHEILHSVSVSHHGGGMVRGVFHYVPALYTPGGAKGSIWLEWGGSKWQRVRLLGEQTGADIVDSMGATLDALVAANAAAMGIPSDVPYAQMDDATKSSLNQLFPQFIWSIGVRNDQHSGNDRCPMRYIFAQVYPAEGVVRKPQGLQFANPATYFLIPPGTEPLGLWLCESSDGTGINAVDHQPQPRFGDAYPNFGNCAAQLCVNDAEPRHPWGIAK